jgi:hypothetical protein
MGSDTGPARRTRQETINSLRQHLPAKGIEDIMFDGDSWKRVELEAKHA